MWGFSGRSLSLAFLVQGHNFYSPVSLKRIIEEIMFMAILEVLWHCESHLYFHTSLFYNLPHAGNVPVSRNTLYHRSVLFFFLSVTAAVKQWVTVIHHLPITVTFVHRQALSQPLPRFCFDLLKAARSRTGPFFFWADFWHFPGPSTKVSPPS